MNDNHQPHLHGVTEIIIIINGTIITASYFIRFYSFIKTFHPKAIGRSIFDYFIFYSSCITNDIIIKWIIHACVFSYLFLILQLFLSTSFFPNLPSLHRVHMLSTTIATKPVISRYSSKLSSALSSYYTVTTCWWWY